MDVKRRMHVWSLLALAALWGSGGSRTAMAQDEPVIIGSKTFTESVILGEVLAQRLAAAGVPSSHRADLGGTRFVWSALLTGDVDAYPEYTGTLYQEIFGDTLAPTRAALEEALESQGLRMTEPLGFNNTYALGMQADRAEALGITLISDLRAHPDLTFGLTNEFMDRGDGWPALRARYDLPQAEVQGISHDLAYRGLASGAIDVMDVYTTDAEIAYYGLHTLDDDLDHFPTYEAVIVYRSDVPDEAARLFRGLAGRIDAATMIGMNAAAKIERRPEAAVAASFLEATYGQGATDFEGTASRWARVGSRTKEHLVLVGISLSAAILVAIPLGILAAKVATLEGMILSVVGVIYTIPSLALLVFMIPLIGIGGPPAMVALFLYSLLPIVRNTHAGLVSIDPAMRESAEALGLTPRARLLRVELPLASRSMLAGIKTAAVINVGTATLGALIGAGGYGQPILTGIRLDDVGLILEGAIPAALLALAVQTLLDVAERWLVPRGLRLDE